jgi:hypothetical protein
MAASQFFLFKGGMATLFVAMSHVHRKNMATNNVAMPPLPSFSVRFSAW